ncbi:hypothetical protein EV384_0890 [Micromonospora kangleipakensis]|uniref:Uncharacterized protein n=1 Tax=Micromonospora kangleipakensis TaxID=1077942 RepID=A0A4Q8B647_9ACTN|nr:hypothetical protein [Micromonospora kangleipakensis]RZU72521.1 hypothetical protein EV384_0890 [Micromonospora kangleipakensis]
MLDLGMFGAPSEDVGVTDVAVEGSRRTHAAVVATAAVALGLLAFAADSVAGVVGQVLIALTSSGFAWGMAAFLAGRSAATAKRAVGGATSLLVLATLLYYLLVLMVSRRWSGGTLEDGTSADLLGLRSVAIMTALWLTGSLVAGPMLGLLGHIVRVGKASTSTLAAGAICGLLSGEGWQAVMQAPPWQLLTVADPYQAEFFRGVVVGELVKIVLPIVVLAWLATAHRLWRAWPMLLTAAISSGALSAALWYVLYAAANSS